MILEVNEFGQVRLKEIFEQIELVSPNGESLSVCMWIGGKFEINSQKETYSVQDGRIEILTKRERLLDYAFFRKTLRLAIADVVYVKGVGLCSHQPDLNEKAFIGHRMQDMRGNIHIITDNSLFFMTTMEERDGYWSTLNKAELRQIEI